jgi:beta-mannosidase
VYDPGIDSDDNSYLSVYSWEHFFPMNRYFFAPIKELRRIPTQPEITITPQGEHEVHVRLYAESYTYFLHLGVPDERTRFSDNYFDLEAGEGRTIIVTNRSITLSPEMVSVGWR